MGRSSSTARRPRAALRIAAALAAIAASGVVQAQVGPTRSQEGFASTRLTPEYALTNNRQPAPSLRLLGDYYFFDPASTRLGPALGGLVGGLRASTGLVGLPQPLSLYDTRPDPSQNLPYIGLGYSHLWFNSQLSLDADFGLASQKQGRGLFNSASALDDVTNQLRWAPVMAVNVRYSF